MTFRMGSSVCKRNLKSLCLLFLLLISVVLLSAGCGKKAKTELGFQPAGLPAIFKCSRQNDGLWAVSGGIITQFGIFSLEQTFDMRDEYTYLVLRNRQKGVDQVFKLGVKGYVEIHTQGEHKLRLQRDENKIVVDVETISGNFDINVYPDSEAIARIELGKGQPDLVVFTDKRLVIEYDSVFWKDDSLFLDSVQSIIYQKDLYSRSFVFKWKDELKNQTTPFVITLKDAKTSDESFRVLEKTIGANASHIRFEQATNKGFIYIWFLISGFFGLIVISSFWTMINGFNNGKTLNGVFCCFICSVTFLIFAVTLVYLAGDMEVVKTVFS